MRFGENPLFVIERVKERLGRIETRLSDCLLFLILVPPAAVWWSLGTVLAAGGSPGLQHGLRLLLVLALSLPLPAFFCWRRFRERGRCRLALDAELAVGRELNLIMAQGFYVFHEFRDEGHQVDHVVAGPAGIYAVAVLGRARPKKGRLGLDAKVLYTGEALYFPDNRKETAVIERARSQAEYLAGWLSSEVDEPVVVEAALALPGWFVEREKPDELILLSGQAPHYARILKGPEIIDEELLKRLVERLDRKCRQAEIQPRNRAYRRRL